MFNFHAVNTAEVNATSRLPDNDASTRLIDEPAVLSIYPTEDMNALSWTSPYFVDFFTIYWSDDPFTSINEPGVHAINDPHGVAANPLARLSYDHEIPAFFSLSVIYYRILSYNRNGSTLSNLVDNYNFKLAIYEEIYQKTLEDLTLRFTPEIRKQYQDSKLWRSFVQSLCSELAQSRFEIKEALKQLNLQKAINIFLNMWNSVIGISRVNVIDPDTGLLIPENDDQYRKRLIDSVFWDKISNLALKKTMLLRLGYEGDILDAGPPADSFRVIPEKTAAKFDANHGLMYFPGEHIAFLFIGPNGVATCVSDDGTTLTYTGYSGPAGTPYDLWGGPLSNGLVWNSFAATPTAAPVLGFAELVLMGGFDAPVSVYNWDNLDTGNEGPPDLTTIYTIRPTAYSSPSGGWWETVVNPIYAYDANINSYAAFPASLAPGAQNLTARLDLFSFSTVISSFTNLTLKVRCRFSVAYGPLPLYIAFVSYSTNGGSSWTLMPLSNSTGDGHFDGTLTASLSSSIDLSHLAVRVENIGGYTISFDDNTGIPTPGYLYEVWVEGSGVPTPGLSLWSSAYGGSMMLRYGIASREYVINTTPAQACTLSFDVNAGSAYMTVSTANDGSGNIIAESLKAVGHYSIPFVSPGSSCRLRFHTHGSEIAYIDNVSCLGIDASAGIIKHAPLRNPFGFWVTTPGTVLEFVAANGTTKTYGKFISNINGVLVFEPMGGLLPNQFDNVRESVTWGAATTLTILLTAPALITSANSTIRPKLLSNTYSVNLGVSTLDDVVLNDIYNEIYPLGAIGNVLTKILQDVSTAFDDWDMTLGNIPYGYIFFMGPTYSGDKNTSSNWSIGETIYMDNQWKVGDNKIFYSNDGPDDMIILTRTT